MTLGRRLVEFAEAIKISHSIFALPFAIASAFLAASGPPSLLLLVKISLACALARTAAMSFNRWADADFDRANPRTSQRAVPAGRLSLGFLLAATVASAAGFVACSAWIHRLAFSLSPIVLVLALGYSWTKRFTSWSHIVLGAALGLAPVGAWVAVTGAIPVEPWILGAAVLTWTAGFDIIYACQDRDFDVRSGLRSIPARFGIAGALWISRALHVVTVGLLIGLGLRSGLGVPYFVGVAGVAILLTAEQILVSPRDLSRVTVAFFTVNGVVGLFFMSAVIVEVVS
jgi:4-hydroxybenzoate polyprenyltransferase